MVSDSDRYRESVYDFPFLVFELYVAGSINTREERIAEDKVR
jgi:hypothetical protein